MSNSLLLTKSIHPDQTTENKKQYHSALGNFLPERVAGFNSFCCLTECLCVWGDEWLRHQGRAAGTHTAVPGGFCPLRIWITPWDKKPVTLPPHPSTPDRALTTVVSFTELSSNTDSALSEKKSFSNSWCLFLICGVKVRQTNLTVLIPVLVKGKISPVCTAYLLLEKFLFQKWQSKKHRSSKRWEMEEK